MPLLAESKRSVALRAKRSASPSTTRRVKGEGGKRTSTAAHHACVFCKTLFASKGNGPLVSTATGAGEHPTYSSCLVSSASPFHQSPANTSLQTFFGLQGRADRVSSIRFTPYARLTRCGHCVCYPCAVAHGATTGRNDCEGLRPSTAVCPSCLRESSFDLCRKVKTNDRDEADLQHFTFGHERKREFHCKMDEGWDERAAAIEGPVITTSVATIEELRARYQALREKIQERPQSYPAKELPISILKKDGFRTPETKGRCIFNESPMDTPSPEPMGLTPMTTSPALTIAHSPLCGPSAQSPMPVVILANSQNDLQLPTSRGSSFTSGRLDTATCIRRHSSFLSGSRTPLSITDAAYARSNQYPNPYDLIFLTNLQPKRLPTLRATEGDESINGNNGSPTEDDTRSTVIATSSSLNALSSPRREMSRECVKVRRLARMQLWLGELQGDGPSPSLCTSARSHRSMTSARSERSADLPLLVAVSDRCMLDGCEDMAVPVIVEGIEEMSCEELVIPSCKVDFPCK